MSVSSLQQMGILMLLSLALGACSTVAPHRSARVGWLESLDRGSARIQRAPANSDRKGLLQSWRVTEKAATDSVSDSSALDSVRKARWIRVARSIQLSWPLQEVHVTSQFGVRGGDLHEGIDLRAPVGTPVFAAHDGRILYSGSGISGYGKLVVIKNPSGISTVYGHNSRLLVRKGQSVRRGQRIALSGSTGRSTGPHLHFEIRAGLKPVDPLQFLDHVPKRPQQRRQLASRQRSTLAATARVR